MKPIFLPFVALLLLWHCFGLHAQGKPTLAPVERRQYYTQRAAGLVKIDGLPNEAAWESVPWGGDFIQQQPNENTPPSYPAFFKIMYDNKYLYIAYYCKDAAKDSVIRRMARRDDFPGDWMEINIDAYHDLRTAFSFTLSASGVRGDEFVSNNGAYWDASWNPIWYAKTHITDSGWTGEIKIPFSQLRYGNEPDKVWGIQVQRRIFRKEEKSLWQFIPQSVGGWVSNFGELRGLKGIPSQKQVEIAPYIVAQNALYKSETGNPFATGVDNKLSAGVDGKVAVTSDMILDFTLNPDFGQVEADPSQVRIDGFQNFFEEHRPFFIESRNIFDYQLTGSAAGGDYDADLLFYSRRIGAAPHYTITAGTGEYVKTPENTAILEAVKFSGKTKTGWSVGLLESVTQREKATIDYFGKRRKEIVEPLTDYCVGRLQKDIDGGNTVIGGIFTSVNRENDPIALLHRNAYSGGLDFLHQWKNKAWYMKGDVVFSRVEGTPQAIYNTQTAFEHLFQRSNMTEAHLDSTRTSLAGTGGSFRIGKTGGKTGKLGQIWRFETGLTWRSPELELNDIGFMYNADEINHFTWAGIIYQQPFSIFRNGRMSYNHWSRWDFAGKFLYQAFNVNAHATFRNYWQTGMGADWNPYDISNYALRGGSSIRRPPGGGVNAYVNTDSRKKISAGLQLSTGMAKDHAVGGNGITLSVTAQPVNAFNVNLSLGYNTYMRKQDQYVDQVVYNTGYEKINRIIVAGVDQKTFRLTLRVNYNITPDLTIQYYGQPFITRPLYHDFGYVIDPLNTEYSKRFHKFTTAEISEQGDDYAVDENSNGITDYTFTKPDFNFVQFRSNLVLRWEYKPGSEFYLVWSQGNTPDVGNDLNTPLGNSLLNGTFTPEAKNIFLAKFTYRFVK